MITVLAIYTPCYIRNNTATVTDMNMKELIATAKNSGVTEFLHQGVMTKVTSRTPASAREDLQKAIEAKQLYVVTPVEPVEDTADTDTETPPEYADSNNEQLEASEQYLKDSINQLVIAEIANDFDKLFSLMGKTPANLISQILSIGTTANTTVKYRSQIFANVERFLNGLPDNKSKVRQLYYYNTIKESVYKSQTMAQLASQKREGGITKLKERKEEKSQINPTKLIIWAVDVLANLHNKNTTHWKHVTQALKVLTGRRTSEILSSGMFLPCNVKGCVLFKGQLKKQSEETFKGESAYIIPVIGGHSELVIQGLLWLENSKKRIKPVDDSWNAQMIAAKQVNRNYGAYLSDFCRGIDGAKLNWYGLVESSNDWTKKQKPDVTRDIYTQVIGCAYYQLVKQELSATLDFLASILGHSGKSTIIKYDVDFVVKYEDIKNFVREIDLKSIPID
ncbi:MAG: hypothetical protein ICV78_10955 [Tolypothrix sp. Co-bin9]|nr:hypothetical protein [Tolypothrix sp. Co-bin9]